MSENVIARTIYGLVGVASAASIIAFVYDFNAFKVMGLFNQIIISLLIIGGLNWLIVALTGDRDKDLFGLLGL
jgi:uncharacterized membrane protein YuzA (DUF378 family)